MVPRREHRCNLGLERLGTNLNDKYTQINTSLK